MRAAADGAPYDQPTPRGFYVHDDLTDEVNRRAGPGSPAAKLAQQLLGLLRADRERVTVLTLDDQLERVVGQGPYPPFDVAIGIGRAGERVAAAAPRPHGVVPARAARRRSPARRTGAAATRW